MKNSGNVVSRNSLIGHVTIGAMVGYVSHLCLSYVSTGDTELSSLIGTTMSYGFFGFCIWMTRLAIYYHRSSPTFKSEGPFDSLADTRKFDDRLQDYIQHHRQPRPNPVAERSRMPFWSVDLSGQGLMPRAAEYFRQLLIRISKLVNR